MFIWRTPLALLDLVRRVVWISFMAATVPIILLAPIVALDATARKLFSVAVPGTLEISEYCIFAITFMAGPWLLRQRRHVRLETLLTITSGRTKAAIETCGFAIGAATSGLMVWEGVRLVLQSFQDGTILYGHFAVPAFWMYLFVPVGSLLYLIEFCCLAVESAKNVHRPSQTPSQPLEDAGQIRTQP
ncbi:MAG: TRAP transporter small permease [Acidobacteriota bacterium]